MKKLLLTVAVATLALSPNAFAAKGNGKEPGKGSKTVTETETQRQERLKKEGQTQGAGTGAQSGARDAQAGNAIRSSGVRFSSADGATAAKNLSAVMASDAAVRSTVDILLKNSSNEAGRTSLEVIAEAARQGLLTTEGGKGLLKFIETQIASELAKGNSTATTIQKMTTSLGEVVLVLRDSANAGKSVDIVAALRTGLERAFPEKTKKEIDEILCKCFGIC